MSSIVPTAADLRTRPVDRDPIAYAATSGGPILLDAYAARSCPVKTQNAFDPTIEAEPATVNDALAALFDGAAAYRAVIFEQLIAAGRGRVADLRLLAEEPRRSQTEACLRAMTVGTDVILGGCLPVDLAGHRVGYPDLLVRGADQPDGSPGYHPAEVKWHKIIERQRPGSPDEPARPGLRYSTVAEPRPVHLADLDGQGLRIGSRGSDFLQLAHYYRMLQACGFAAGSPLGAVIGTDTLLDTPILAWADLDEPLVRTFSRSHLDGWRLRSILERYDYELAFRLDIADVARRQTGDLEHDPRRLVGPIVNHECARCPWWEHCRPQLHPDDVSLRIDKARLDLREIAALRRLGVWTVSDLAAADLDELSQHYLPEVTHRLGAEGRLRTAARRARMLVDHTAFARETEGPIEVPTADIEVDLDIESAADGRIYLWGFLVRYAGQPDEIYHEFSRFTDLDDEAETALAVDAFTWLRSLIDSVDRVAVYHYSGYEVARIRALADREHRRELDWAAAYAEEQFVDLLEVVKTHFFGVNGLGLKLIAAHAGFQWRDDDPGGLNSQLWFAEAVHGSTAEIRAQARTRVLEYNEDDVLATSRLRAWLRAQ